MTIKTKIRIVLSLIFGLLGCINFYFIVALENKDPEISAVIGVLSLIAFFACRSLLNSISKPLSKLIEHYQNADIKNWQPFLGAKENDEFSILDSQIGKLFISDKKDRSTLVDKEFVDSIIQSMVDMLIVLNEDAKIIRTNKVTLDLLGFSEEELIGRDFFDLISLSERSTISSESVIMHKLFDGNKIAEELSLTNKNGDEIPVYLAGSLMDGGSTEGAKFVFTARDMTDVVSAQGEKKQIEKQLAQSAKLASLGTLGAGIAHELNNPLVGVRGYAELIMVEQGASDRVVDLARKVIKASDRMQKIIKHLRSFAADTSENDRENFNINETINNSLTLLKQQLHLHAINIDVKLDANLPLIFGDASSIESIFQNLLANARDAFKDVTDDREKLISITSITTSSSQVEIVFRDNADGIPDDIIKSIFDPFFTTKEVGQGTGLGLSISHGIVSDHSGTIVVTSEPGEGSVFTIVLPASENQNSKFISDHSAITGFESTNVKPKLAIVDDEQMVLEILDTYLKDDFELTLFNNPMEATVDFAEIRYDIVITDMKMPEISGLQVIKDLKDSAPDTVAIVITGHAQTDLEIAEAVEAGAAGVIPKPFPKKQEMIDLIMDFYNNRGMDEPATIISPAQDTAEVKNGKKSILVVDDQDQICEILDIFLSDDYNVVTTFDSAEGLRLVNLDSYDLLITDLQMPEVSGFEIIRGAIESNPNIKIIAMSGNDEKHPDCKKAMDLGANQIMMKPFKGKASILDQIDIILNTEINQKAS